MRDPIIEGLVVVTEVRRPGIITQRSGLWNQAKCSGSNALCISGNVIRVGIANVGTTRPASPDASAFLGILISILTLRNCIVRRDRYVRDFRMI